MRAKPLVAALLLAASSFAWAGVTVQFVQPEKYSDMPRSPSDREDTMKQLQAHLQELGAKLPAGVELALDVTDIDLAGRLVQGRVHELRVMHGGADWPSMEVQYKLSRDGAQLAAGTARIKDMDYTQHFNRYGHDDALRYERQMLDDWFKKDILPLAAK